MSGYLPNSYLLGVHLTISTHSGPQVVYSYPPTSVEYISSRQRENYKPTKRRNDYNLDTNQKTTTASNVSDVVSVSSSSSSSSSSWSSDGLSESELSTDYADISFSSESDNDSETRSYSGTRSNSNTPNQMKSVKPSLEKINSENILEMLNEQDALSDTNSNETFDDSDIFEKFQMNSEYFTEENYQDIDKIFGFNTEFVAEFCSPDRELCNVRFELTIDQLCFLGFPVHSDSNGKWRKSKHKRHTSKKSSNSSRRRHSISSARSSISRATDRDNDELDTDLQSISHSTSNKEELENDEKNDLDKNMNMFHVCFILNPPLIEYNKRIDDMYQYVVAKLSLLLRYVQSKSNYVSRECSIILKEREHILKSSQTYQSMKSPSEKGKYLYEKILSKSSLARSLTKCVDQLHKNEIACIEIGDERFVSLQIPIQNEFMHLPEFKQDPILPNSYLTTVVNSQFLERVANTSSLNQDDDDDILNYALLLLDEPINVLKALETTLNSTNPNDINTIILRHIVKEIRPTTPLISYHYIITDTLQMEASTITYDILRSCALHLIYWRHARVVVPFSSKFTYIVSPLVSLGQVFTRDERLFKDKYPSVPSLDYFLSKLSASHNTAGQSRLYQFGNLIPSKEHKAVYMDVLGWLVRYGYVCQLLTFVYIRVDKRIKIAVDEDLEKEGFKKGKRYNQKKKNRLEKDSYSRNEDASTDVDNRMKEEMSEANDMIKNSREMHNGEDLHFEFDDPNMQQDYTIILEPERATALEKRWIFKCISDQPSDIQILFNKLLKYFDGRIPLEVIMLRENVSRHEIKKLFNAMGKYLIEVYHW